MAQSVEVRQAPADQRFETWRSVTRSKVRLKRIGEFGKIHSEVIASGAAFHITPEERRLNQIECAKLEYDVFTNGMLQPVALFDDDPDYERLTTNPNLLEVKEDDPTKLFKLHGAKFVDRVKAITSVSTMRRLLELAEDERTKATVAQHRLIEDHLAEIDSEVIHVKSQIQEKIEKGEKGPSGDEDTFTPQRLSS